ncbi:MAG TPA: sigma-70 family RNA polymerase sigma factor [Vicinamibacterales bacterium]|jgi:RNA polymerase sigma-70 factor (ECF subfamily)
MWISKVTGSGTLVPRWELIRDEDGAAVGVANRSVMPLAGSCDELFQEHASFIYRTAYGVTGRHEDAEDVLQTLFLRLLRRDLSQMGAGVISNHEVTPDPITVLSAAKNPKAYLYRAAVNLSLNIVRVRRRQVAVDVADLPEVAVPASDSLDDDEHHRYLYQAIAELKPEAAEILILRYVHDKSDAEIARMLGVSRGTIALRLFRSRARLKTLLAARMGVKL